MKKLSILLFCLIIFSSFAYSQEQYGNIRGVVLDKEGNPMMVKSSGIIQVGIRAL
jgi:hypothetical protein